MNDPPALTPFCYTATCLCELCGSRQAVAVARTTRFGPACMDLCPTCQKLPEPIVVRTPVAARDHREHLTRAADLADPRRGTT